MIVYLISASATAADWITSPWILGPNRKAPCRGQTQFLGRTLILLGFLDNSKGPSEFLEHCHHVLTRF